MRPVRAVHGPRGRHAGCEICESPFRRVGTGGTAGWLELSIQIEGAGWSVGIPCDDDTVAWPDFGGRLDPLPAVLEAEQRWQKG